MTAKIENRERKIKKISILGSTGSIGCSTLDVVRAQPDRFEIVALAAHSRVDKLVEQFHEFHPQQLCLIDYEAAEKLKKALAGEAVEILAGEEALVSLASAPEVELILNAVVGSAGLRASIETLKSDKDLALANKESLVSGGPLFPALLKKSKGRILPVDSEHSAIWQAIRAGRENELSRIILTASGGPFRGWTKDRLAEVTPEQALAHPTWKMGPKISIDSSTLVNKGLEVIEAVVLFSIPASQVEVVVHPQSIIHSMVEFADSSVIAQLSKPDMRLPISYALFWPDRVESGFGKMDFTKLADLTFEKPDFECFPALKLAYEAADLGGTAPAIYSAANEVAVPAFLDRKIKYLEIADMIRGTLSDMTIIKEPTLKDILTADKEARQVCSERMEISKC